MFPLKKVVAIVAFAQDVKNAALLDSLSHPVPRVVQYQVTLDPERVSPGGEFIRFGQWNDQKGQGDEITGWVMKDDLTILEVIAEWDGDKFLTVQHSAERAA
jgi:hypothetical protein